MTDNDDFIENIRRRDAAEAARRKAIAGPEGNAKPRKGSPRGYLAKALFNEVENVQNAVKGERQTTLNTACFNLGQLVQPGGLDFEVCKREMISAALACGLTRRELKSWDLPDRGLHDGMTKLRDLSRIESESTTFTGKGSDRKTDDDDEWDESDRRILLKPLGRVKTSVPAWVWTYEDVGRIQLGTLSLFAGKPAAGKSTATRWFAAQLSRGLLPGIWYGTAMKVAVFSPEEGLEDTIAPSLQAHDADMSNIVALSAFEAGIEDSILSVRDEAKLTETLSFNGIRALFVDPVIQTFDAKLSNTNNTGDVRRNLMPYVRIAKAINGIVVGVTHLRKGNVIDVMTNINGSSAFGELPRSIFGFASVGDGMNVLEQVKNSAGVTGLKLEYRLPIERGLADDGQYYELPRFEIKGETELSIIDIGGNDTEDDATTSSAGVQWLERYLQIEQPARSADVYRTAEKQAGMTRYQVTKARKKLRVRIVNTPLPDAPHTTAWCLPDFKDT